MGNKRNRKRSRPSATSSHLSRRSIIHRSAAHANQMNFVPRNDMSRGTRACMYIYAEQNGMERQLASLSARNAASRRGINQLQLAEKDATPVVVDRKNSLTEINALTVTNNKTQSDIVAKNPELPFVRSDQSKKRVVIIDGNDVALAHSLGLEFSVRGLEICINFINNMGHEARAVVPIYRKSQGMATDLRLLNELYAAGKIIFAPCKNIMGEFFITDDDRVILEVANRLGAVVLSNDSYSKLYDESLEFREIIDNRILSYVWTDDEMVLLKDPYGLNGPTLDKILTRT